MPTSIPQSRQQLSADYFARNQAAARTDARSLFDRVQGLREKFAPRDDTGLDAVECSPRQTAWQRGNAFSGTF